MDKKIHRCMILLLLVGALAFSSGAEDSTTDQAGTTAAPQTGKYKEAPMLAELVRQGLLPAVAERLPQDPLVVQPVEEIGQYGGDWRHVTLSPTSSWINRRTGYEPLVRYALDATSIAPNIASGWSVVDDGKTYIFTLREGMKWSDGAAFSADDVTFWYQDRLLNEELTPSFPRWLTTEGERVNVVKVNDYEVRFEFSAPYGVFLNWIAQSDTLFSPKSYLEQFHPSYVSAETLSALAAENGFEFWYQFFGQQDHIATNPERPVIKPWKLASSGEQQVILERNPYYWKVDTEGNQLPYLDRRVVSLISETEVLNIKTMAGEYDAQLDFLPPSNFTLFMENREAGDYRVLKHKGGESGLALFPNQTLKDDQILAELFRDAQFRTALSLAINRDEVKEILYLGVADPVETVLFSSSMWGSQEANEIIDRLYSYDPDRANVLLDELGLQERTEDGFRIRSDGKVLEITIDVPTAFSELVDGVELVKDYWEKIGIKTFVKSEKFELFVLRTRASEAQVAAFEMNRIGWVADPRSYVPVSPDTYWGPQYSQWYLSDGKMGVEPPSEVVRLIELYEQVSRSIDMEERARIAEALFADHAKQVIVIPTVGLTLNVAVVKDDFRNVPDVAYNAWPLKYPGYLNPEQFFIRN